MFNSSLVWELTRRDFSERFAGSILGSLWALILPLVSLMIYIIIFGKLMGGRLPGSSNIYAYSIYVTVGLVPWTAFASSISRCSSVFLDKKHLLSKINLSFPSLLLYINLSEAITFSFSMAFFFIFLLLTGYDFTINIILVPYIFYLQQLLTFGIGLLAATLTVFIRDVKEIITVILQFWFWFTPIVYVRDILPDLVKKVMIYNPAYIIIESYHRIFVFNDEPSYTSLIILTLITHIIVLVSYSVFRSLERDVRDFL
jgi:lipopolysaccharide transport system permease protein